MDKNLFVLSTGFHYYFSLHLIRHLGLKNVVFAMYHPREKIEQRAACGYRVVHADHDDLITRVFDKRTGKWFFAERAFRKLGLKDGGLNVFTPYYNDITLYAFRSIAERYCKRVNYNMIPDGAALLRRLPGTPKFQRMPDWMRRRVSELEPADVRHKSGSYSKFINKIYHFPASTIFADQSKLHIVPVQQSAREPIEDTLVLGGLRGVTPAFIRAVDEKAAGRPVRYRMHPKNQNGNEYVRASASHWRELKLNCSLEEHLLECTYSMVLGCYSSAVVFNHLFVRNSISEFVIDSAYEDCEYHSVADACGIPVRVVATNC